MSRPINNPKSMEDVTIAIKTFERPECLRDILVSIRDFYPDIKVLVADDTKVPYAAEVCSKFEHVEAVELPFDVGTSQGRNELLKRITTKYFVLCDDDFLFCDETSLETFKEILETSDIELVGGVVRHMGKTGEFDRPTTYAGYLSITEPERDMKMEFIGLEHDLIKCDITHNFFMADTEAIRSKLGGWDGKFKLVEHNDFFWTAKQKGLVVAFTGKVIVNHSAARTVVYNKFRMGRRDKYFRMLFKKYNIRSMSWTDGRKPVTMYQVQPEWYKRLHKSKIIPWRLINKLRGK